MYIYSYVRLYPNAMCEFESTKYLLLQKLYSKRNLTVGFM